MGKVPLRAVVVLAGAVLMACATAGGSDGGASAALGTRDTALGSILVDAQGMTLYTYAEDEPGVSHCGLLCRAYWPPARATVAAQAAGDLTIITGADGEPQWAYKGMPLYTYVDDEAPGDVTGEGQDGEWYVIKQP